jgi:profilin
MNILQNLLHDALISTNHVEKSAILNRNERSVKACSIGFFISNEDIETLLNAFENLVSVRDKGIYFDEIYYRCIRADEHAIYARDGNRGLIMVPTKNCILIGTYKENMFPSVCVEAVEKLADYFKQKEK